VKLSVFDDKNRRSISAAAGSALTNFMLHMQHELGRRVPLAPKPDPQNA